MKIKAGFVLRELAGQSIVIALGEASKTFNGMIKLNDTGRVIWNMLSEGNEASAIVDKFVAEYDVDRETAERDVNTFIEALRGADILE
ncbi:MAG: PqqD family protein [Clostridia bacterium]|nr:PqqD family protein [Clostridia bacterium]